MNKDRFLFVFVGLELLVFIALMFINIDGFILKQLWFSFALAFLAIFGLVYFILYGLDSSLYYGVLLLCFSLATAFRFINAIKFTTFYPAYILCFAMAHLTTFVKFRQNIHFKVFAILFVEAILLISYKNNLLPIFALIGINAIYLIFVAINAAIRLGKNLRRE